MTPLRLELNRAPHESEGDKRQYAPYILDWTCGDCRTVRHLDFRQSYLSYPKFDAVNAIHLYCETCGSESTVQAKVSLVLELVEP